MAAAQQQSQAELVKALVDAGMRSRQPERTFPAYTDVEQLAAAAVGLFSRPAGELNGQRLVLVPEPAGASSTQSAATT
jgi:3-oxoacyl-[acyl-carrier protein] reductase